MDISKLKEEAKNSSFLKTRKLISPFSSFSEVWFLLHDDKFALALKEKKFYFFIRKKLFWILDQSHESCTCSQFNLISNTETNPKLTAISDQVLLTYFSDDLSHIDLESIALRADEYNTLTAYRINSARGTTSKSSSN